MAVSDEDHRRRGNLLIVLLIVPIQTLPRIITVKNHSIVLRAYTTMSPNYHLNYKVEVNIWKAG